MTRFNPKKYPLAARCFVVFQFVSSDFKVILTASQLKKLSEEVAACRRIGWPLMRMRQVMGYIFDEVLMSDIELEMGCSDTQRCSIH